MNEIWKPIAGYEGLYEVSNLGRLKSFWYGRERILNPSPNHQGYPEVTLCQNGEHRLCHVHRLVAQTFIPNPQNKREVNHINGIKSDNRVENLEWATPAENSRHARATGLKTEPQGEDRPGAKLANEQVRFIRENPNELSNKQLAGQFGVSEATIWAIQLGKTYKNAGGTIRNPKRPRIPDDIRKQIRGEYVFGSSEFGSVALGKKYGVDPKTISNIVREGQ